MGTGLAKRVEGQVGTTEGEVGRPDIGILRTRRGGRSQSWKGVVEVVEVVAVVAVRNTHSGPVSIHERYEKAVAKIVQAA